MFAASGNRSAFIRRGKRPAGPGHVVGCNVLAFTAVSFFVLFLCVRRFRVFSLVSLSVLGLFSAVVSFLRLAICVCVIQQRRF